MGSRAVLDSSDINDITDFNDAFCHFLTLLTILTETDGNVQNPTLALSTHVWDCCRHGHF